MSTVLPEAELRKAIEDEGFIKNGTVACAEGLKYDFRVGQHILLGQGQPLDVTKLSEGEKRDLLLKPGELGYVMTEERLDLPTDIKAELSLKRKMSHAGILVLGGFCVDPGYVGRLMFALYNFSSTPFPLKPGRKLIAAQFYKLSPEEVPPTSQHKPLEEFPADIVRWMLDYKPTSPESLQATISELKASLEDLRSQAQRKEEWFDRFQGIVEKHGTQIEQLLEGLKDEGTNRQGMERDFRKDLKDVQFRTTTTATIVATISAVVVAVGGGIVAALVAKAMGAV